MTDYTTIATAAIAATSGLLGAALGYLGARVQASAEIDRLKQQHREDHLRHRQGVYHDFLDAAKLFGHSLSAERLAGDVPAAAADDIPKHAITEATDDHHRSLLTYTHAYNAALLFAVPAVRAAVEKIEDQRAAMEKAVERAVSADFMRNPAHEPFRDRFWRVCAQVDQTEWKAAIEELVSAMRDDVAPDVVTKPLPA